MVKVAVITDSDASLPKSLAESLGIRQVPITVLFGDETFETGININDAQVFARIDREDRLPTTSAPSPGKFAAAYEEAFNSGVESIVCLTVSSQVSATYNAAVTARDMCPGKDISVIDTHSLSLGQGYMALAAAEAAAGGADAAEVIARALAVGQRAHLFAALSTLKYLAMSGRVGHVAANIADLFNVKPVLTIREGKLDLIERVRTQRKAWTRLLSLTAETLGQRPIERMGVVHVNALEAARQFEAELRIALPTPDEILITELTPGLSVHAGAGLVGVAFVAGAAA
jgi:DegV family protein with EDD domain